MSGGSVLDPFLGTGTTWRRAKRLGLECDGCEIDLVYCRHIAAETGERVIGPEEFYGSEAA